MPISDPTLGKLSAAAQLLNGYMQRKMSKANASWELALAQARIAAAHQVAGVELAKTAVVAGASGFMFSGQTDQIVSATQGRLEQDAVLLRAQGEALAAQHLAAGSSAMHSSVIGAADALLKTHGSSELEAENPTPTEPSTESELSASSPAKRTFFNRPFLADTKSNQIVDRPRGPVGQLRRR